MVSQSPKNLLGAEKGEVLEGAKIRVSFDGQSEGEGARPSQEGGVGAWGVTGTPWRGLLPSRVSGPARGAESSICDEP